MCYNYSLIIYKNQREFEETFGASFNQDPSIKNNYLINSFSLPKMPVITNEKPDQFQNYYWGLIPFWTKDIENAEKIRTKTMNARAETLFEKPSYRNSIINKRCLIPASGFFEWRYVFGKNYPYYIHLKNQKWFSFAGIWDNWFNSETNEQIFTYSIITCEPNNLLKKIHNKKKRMPVILPIENQKDWLNNSISEGEIKKFLVSYPDNEMEAYTISKLITSKLENKNIPDVIKPYNYPELKSLN